MPKGLSTSWVGANTALERWKQNNRCMRCSDPVAMNGKPMNAMYHVELAKSGRTMVKSAPASSCRQLSPTGTYTHPSEDSWTCLRAEQPTRKQLPTPEGALNSDVSMWRATGRLQEVLYLCEVFCLKQYPSSSKADRSQISDSLSEAGSHENLPARFM